jgi:glycine cleavage system aminomethyltransferase T
MGLTGDGKIAKIKPWEITIPEKPGQCLLENGVLINRMNRTQASIWHLSGDRLQPPDGSVYTDTTDTTLFLALAGKQIFSITEKLTSLDFSDPEKKAPFLLQGPVSHVPCQVVVLEKNKDSGTIMLTCSRGYAHDMVNAILKAGEEFGLRPAGENAFGCQLKKLSI